VCLVWLAILIHIMTALNFPFIFSYVWTNLACLTFSTLQRCILRHIAVFRVFFNWFIAPKFIEVQVGLQNCSYNQFTTCWSALYSLTQSPYGAIHRLLTIVNFKFFNPNVLESMVIFLETPLLHTHIRPFILNSFTSLFTVWRINSSSDTQLILTLLFAK
jgi:hypothetical protein